MPILGNICSKVHQISEQIYSSDFTDSGGTSGTQSTVQTQHVGHKRQR